MTDFLDHRQMNRVIIPDGASSPTVGPAWNTPEAIEIMKTLWAEGKSATEIGSRLGVTKNAILGKIRRLGLHRYAPKVPREPKPPRRERRLATAKTPGAKANIAQAQPSTPARVATTVPKGAQKEVIGPLFRVRPLTCRWPLWADDAKPDHTYCGKPAVAAWPGVYCAECRIKAFPRTAAPSNVVSEALPSGGGDRSAA